MEKKCSVEGCDRKARSKGMCSTHYVKLWRTGTLESLQPEGYGSKTKHPLYITWSKAIHLMCDEWKDFWKFIADMGDRPEDGKYRIKRLDESLPYSRANCVWKKVEVSKAPGEGELEYRRRREAVTGKKRGPYTYEKGLKANHGLTLAQYEAMHEAQNGLCAICGKPETKTGGVNNVPMRLAVDHCHKTRQSGESNGIRGLLCQACNIGLGKFDDDVELLRKAIAYLEKYRE